MGHILRLLPQNRIVLKLLWPQQPFLALIEYKRPVIKGILKIFLHDLVSLLFLLRLDHLSPELELLPEPADQHRQGPSWLLNQKLNQLIRRVSIYKFDGFQTQRFG